MTLAELQSMIIPPECKKRECTDNAGPMHRGFCPRHYVQNLKQHGRMKKKGCSEPGCPNIHRSNGLCSTHYNRQYQRKHPR